MKWLFAASLALLTACGAEPGNSAPERAESAPGVVELGRIVHPRIAESSGVVASRKSPLVLWTHNDGGGRRQVLYAMTHTGQVLGEFRVTGALLEDWEDIAIDDKGHLFLGDIGDNDAERPSIAVHQVDEPDLTKSQNGLAHVTRSFSLKYPRRPFDCEALVVWRESGYLISKVFDDERADLFRFSLTNSAAAQTLQFIGELRIGSPVTGADLSADGKLLGIVAKNGAYVYRVNGDLARATRGKPYHTRFRHEHIEACTFVPEGLLATAESREIFLFTDEPFRTGPVKKK